MSALDPLVSYGPKAIHPLAEMTTNWRFGRNILFAGSLCACGFSLDAGAEESKDAGAIPPIFSQTARPKGPAQVGETAIAAPAPRAESTEATLRAISEGLPGFDSKLALDEANQAEAPSGPGLTTPLLMKPFTVYDGRVLELRKPHETLLERINATEPMFHFTGKKLSSELTFVDLALASNWRPFSIDPPPAMSVRFTISW